MTDSTQARPTAAVIGGGVSGLTAAYLLQKTHHVTLFEADERLGGHAHTHDVAARGRRRRPPVDSGFIVLNDRTYPLLRRLFAELGVQTRPTEMSMSITLRRVRAELRRRPRGERHLRPAAPAARPALLAAAAVGPPLPEGGPRAARTTSRTAR